MQNKREYFFTAVSLNDADELLAFEMYNRAFFESRINARPANYYNAESVRAAIVTAEAERDQDKGYQFLIRDAQATLVGRVNLTHVRRAHFHSAELGYRVAEAAQGRGVAKSAVGFALNFAFQELKLIRVEAQVHAENPASQAVLRAHGFQEFGRAEHAFELGGQWFDKLYFHRRAQNE